ncbi:FAD-dependent monooxygenase [Glutamicibacter sp.]|uniref:FAD-dependent monooxygenase n=1 Tax=Glutamicibacter sp. TaxID=1931995 RepID=UPI003D6AD9BA
MKAIIIGAGIAGLVAARQLGLAGWEVRVLERSNAPRPDGYMMDFFGPGVEASERIGLHPYLAEVAYQVQAAQYVDRQGKPTASLDYSKFSGIAGGKVLTLLRPDMEAAARKALEEVDPSRLGLHYGVHIDQLDVHGQQVHVRIRGRSKPEVADLLVGADGIHSAVRARFFGPEEHYLRPLGMRAAAFIVREPELNRRYRNRFVMTDTLDRTAGIYGLRTDEVASFLVYRHDHAAPLGPALARLRHVFAGCGAQVDRLLALCPEDPYDDAVAQVVMDSWYSGPVVLIGDAAAAVSLLAGQGGAMAVCAGAALGDALGGVVAPGQLQPALARYEQMMRPKIATAQASGRRAANSFLPRNKLALWIRRTIIRSTNLPGMDRLVARQILKRLAK